MSNLLQVSSVQRFRSAVTDPSAFHVPALSHACNNLFGVMDVFHHCCGCPLQLLHNVTPLEPE